MNNISDQIADRVELTKVLTRLVKARGDAQESLRGTLQIGVEEYRQKYNQAWAPYYGEEA